RNRGRPEHESRGALRHGVGGLLLHDGESAGRLHQHRQRRRRGRLRGAQSELRFQRRDHSARRHPVGARRREEAGQRRAMSDAAQNVKNWLLRDLPYAAMLAFALGGLVLTSFRGSATYYYWMAMAPIYGLIVVASGWRQLDTGGERFQLVMTQ